MKVKRKLIIIGIVVIFILSGISLAQESKISAGLDYGSAVIQPSTSLVLYSGGFRQQTINWEGVPKQVRGMVSFSFHSYILLRVSGGYASTRYKRKIQYTDSVKTELGHEFYGFPVDLALIILAPIDNREKFNLRFGLGGGFYSYKLESKYIREGFISPGPDTRIPDVKFSGFAQTFILGFSIRPFERLDITFELVKLGLSAIKEKQDILASDIPGIPPQKIGENEKNYNAAPGLQDLAMTLGVNFHL